MERPRLWTSAFLLAFAANFVASLGLSIFVHIGGYLDDLGATETEIGFIVGILHITALLARPMVGRFIDSAGRRPVALIGCATHVVAVACYFTVDALGPWLWLVRMIHGLSEAILASVFFTMAADIVPRSRRTEGIALFGVSGILPVSLGALLGDWVLSFGTYTTLFLAALVIAVFDLILSAFVPETRPAHSSGEPAYGFVSVLSQRELFPLWLMGSTFAIAITSYFTFLKTYVLAIEVGSVGAFFLAYSLTAILERIFLGRLPDRFGAKRVLVPAVLFLVSGILLLSIGRTETMLILAGILAGAGHGYIFPILSSLVIDRSAPGDRGSALAIFTAVFDLGTLIGGPALGAIAEMKSYPAMYQATAAITAFGYAVFLVLDRKSRRAIRTD